MQAIVETLFDAVYLISVITIGVVMILKISLCLWDLESGLPPLR